MKARGARRSATNSVSSDASPSGTDELLHKANLALEATVALAPLVPVPVLSSVFSSVQVIVNAAKKCREDRREAAEVAEQAAEMTKMIHETIRGKEDRIDEDLRRALEDFELKLQDIKSVMLEQSSASFVRRLTHRARFSEGLQTHKARLEYSMRTFSALSQTRLEIKMDELRNEVQRLRKRHDDGYRIVYLGDLDFTQPSISKPGRHSLSRAGDCNRDVEVFNATRKGELKLVKLYRNDKKFRGELEFLKLARRIPKSSFAQIEGYSSTSDGSLIVLTGVSTLNLLDNYLSSLDSVKRFAALLQVSCSWVSVSEFFQRAALLWEPDYSRMQVDAAGELVIGVHDKIGRAVHEGHNPGCTYIGMSIDVGREQNSDRDNLGMAPDVEACRSLLNLVRGFDVSQMTFNRAMGILHRVCTPFFVVESITTASSSNHPYRVGQVRDFKFFKDGYMLEVPVALNKASSVVHDEESMPVEVFVPFGHEPRRLRRSHRVKAFDMGWGNQCSRPLSTSVGRAHSVVLDISEHAEPCDMGLSSFFCRFGPSLAKTFKTSLQDLCFVSGISEIRFAQLVWTDEKGNYIRGFPTHDEVQESSKILCEFCVQSAYRNGPCKVNNAETRNFHVRALGQDSSVKEPWGLFANETEPTLEFDMDKAGILKMEPAVLEQYPWWLGARSHHNIASDEEYQEFIEPYYQVAPGVVVIYSRFIRVSYCRLPVSMAGAIQWIHDRFPDEAKENERLFSEAFGGESSIDLKDAFSCFSSN